MAMTSEILRNVREPIPSSELSFNTWLLDKHNMVEKSAGAVVLVVEFFTIAGHIFHKTPEIPLTQILNFAFLVFVFVKLNEGFSHRFTVDPRNKKAVNVLGLWRYSDKHIEQKMSELVRRSNQLLGQLRNVNYFILATAVLYLLLLLKLFLEGENDKFHIFHLLIDLTSYVGAFYLLRCFFVMYLPTIERGRDVLSKKTNPYIWVGVALMILDICLTKYMPVTGVFVAEFICGIVNAVVFVLFIARFENKVLDIPPYILVMLYAYAVLQTCLPFVTNTGLIFGSDFSEAFSSIVFKLVLIGKVALAAVLFYVLTSRRIFYYFMALRTFYDQDEEERHWEEFKTVIIDLPQEPEVFEITYCLKAGKIIAHITPALFGSVSGHGGTAEEAKADLLRRLPPTLAHLNASRP
jgi:hypothetical protein